MEQLKNKICKNNPKFSIFNYFVKAEEKRLPITILDEFSEHIRIKDNFEVTLSKFYTINSLHRRHFTVQSSYICSIKNKNIFIEKEYLDVITTKDPLLHTSGLNTALVISEKEVEALFLSEFEKTRDIRTETYLFFELKVRYKYRAYKKLLKQHNIRCTETPFFDNNILKKKVEFGVVLGFETYIPVF